jgi:hypothetical protein
MNKKPDTFIALFLPQCLCIQCATIHYNSLFKESRSMNLAHQVTVMGAKDSFQSSHSNERNIWLHFCDIIPESSRIVGIFSFSIEECAVLNSTILMVAIATEEGH